MDNNIIEICDFWVSKILTVTKYYTKSQKYYHYYFALEIDKWEYYNNKIDFYEIGCLINELFVLNEYYSIQNEN